MKLKVEKSGRGDHKSACGFWRNLHGAIAKQSMQLAPLEKNSGRVGDMDSQTLQAVVTYAALLFGTVSFVVFFILALGLEKKSEPAHVEMLKKAEAINVEPAKTITPGEFVDILKAITALGDTLSKAGPSLSALIGSVLFLAIAAVSSGSIRDPDKSLTGQKNPSDQTSQLKVDGAKTPSP